MDKASNIKGAIAIATCVLCCAAIIVGYSKAVRIGILYTIYAIPFFVAAIILSALSMKKHASQRLSIVGLSIGIGGLAASWLFAGFVVTVGLFSGLDSSTTSDMGFLSLLNWE